MSVLLVEPRAYTVLRTERASELQLLRPPPNSQGHLLAPGWSPGHVGGSSGPTSFSSQPAPLLGPKDAHSLFPRGAGRDGTVGRPRGRVTATAGILDPGVGDVDFGNSSGHSCPQRASGSVEPARKPPTGPTLLRPV